MLERPKLQRYIAADDAVYLLARIREEALVLQQLPDEARSPDPNDNHILAAAITGGAKLIVSGDEHDLLALREVDGIKIITAAEAAERVEQRAGDE